MKSSKKLALEIQKLNKQLERISTSSRFMVFSANPIKFAWYNFLAGIFHSLGSLFGTVIIAGAIIYVLAQLHLSGYFAPFIDNSLRLFTRPTQLISPPSQN